MTSEKKNTNLCFVYVPEVVSTVHVTFVCKQVFIGFRTNTENIPTEGNSFLGGGCDFMFTFIINGIFSINDRFKELFDYCYSCYKDHIKFVSFLTFQYTMILLSILNSDYK